MGLKEVGYRQGRGRDPLTSSSWDRTAGHPRGSSIGLTPRRLARNPPSPRLLLCCRLLGAAPSGGLRIVMGYLGAGAWDKSDRRSLVFRQETPFRLVEEHKKVCEVGVVAPDADGTVDDNVC